MVNMKKQYWTAYMVTYFILAVAIAGCGSSAKLSTEIVGPDVAGSEYQKVFDQYSESIPEKMKNHKIPGLSIAVVDTNGILWTAGFGKTGRANQPVTPETLFSIQSMSKTFTATAVMMAVQDGLVELDTPITKYLPDFTVKSRYEQNPQEKITLRHLLSHTSGFTHEAPVGNNMDTRYSSFEEHVLSIQDTWLKFRVGEKYSYSNLGIDLAAYILQVKSGMPFEQYLKLKVFDQLGMPNSSVDYDFVASQSNRAIGHVHPLVVNVPVEIPMVGAGGVYTSATELSRFVQFHLNRGEIDGRLILDANLIDAMYTSSPISEGYALGIGIGKSHDTYYLNHNGGGFGFSTTMTWCPEYGIGCIVLTNSTSHGQQNNAISNEILLKLVTEHIVTKDTSGDIPSADSLIGKDMKLSPLPDINDTHTPTPFQPQWKQYVGTYRFIYRGYKLHPIAYFAMVLGYCHPELKMSVVKKDGYLCIGNEKLEEFQPGLFVTPSGEMLDLRNPVPKWRNIKMEKSRFLWSL
jgi:CubicO group peptidase (beta-lactamase class C family)